MFLVFPIIDFPGHLRYASANLDLVLPVHKHNSLLAELRSVALAMIHERYPDEDWLHVFTDGSATTLVGLELVLSPTLLILKNLLVPGQTNFDGEIYALFMAFRVISATLGQNIVIFIDSQAAIKTISGDNLFPSKLEFEYKQLINSFLCTGREVVLQWIPSHCGIHGNEQANKLAKEASMLHPPCLLMPLRNARDRFRHIRISTLTDLAVGKSWSHLLDGQRHAQLSALPRGHVSESSPDMITCKPICLRLAWLIHRSALSVNLGQ
ncbi:uncharacterized protein LOC103524116 [Trichonephila clavipes]|nr:uncharacterized protein LOC103524116 [Trichonephila clavipes]